MKRPTEEADGPRTGERSLDEVIRRMTPDQRARLDAALELARKMFGADRSRYELLQAIAANYLAKHAWTPAHDRLVRVRRSVRLRR